MLDGIRINIESDTWLDHIFPHVNDQVTLIVNGLIFDGLFVNDLDGYFYWLCGVFVNFLLGHV